MLRIYHIVLIVLWTALISRVLVAFGVPSIVNFIHFGFALLGTLLVLPKAKGPLPITIAIGCAGMAGVVILSAILNQAGYINILLDFLLLVEPFLLLLMMIAIPWPEKHLKQFILGFWGLMILHVVLAYFQRWGMGLMNDDVEGLFIGMGAGSHVAGAVAASSALLFYSSKKRPKWFVAFGGILMLAVVWFSDAKQVIVVFLGAVGILTLKDLGKGPESKLKPFPID